MNKVALLAVAAIGAAAAAPAYAQDAKGPEVPTSPLIGKLETCRAITEDAERLACFDREVGALVGAADKGEVKVVDAEEITQTRRRLFGFSLPKIGLFGGGDEEEVKTLTSTITRVRHLGGKEYVFWIEEGNAQWRMKGRTVRFRAPKVGDSVEFKPASMGTYWIRVNGRKGVRGNRVG